jgi:transposase-like protein
MERTDDRPRCAVCDRTFENRTALYRHVKNRGLLW